MYLLINFCQGSYMWVNNSERIAMHEPYKSDDISCKKHLQLYTKVRPSEVESYLKLIAWTEWQQEDLISEYGQGA